MSNLSKKVASDCDAESGCDAIKVILTPKDKDLGGFTVRRTIPTIGHKSIGPWVFFDHMGPASFAPGEGVNVRPHPHIGLATVTYLFEGEMLHRDSLGTEARVLPGDINLMVAGKGIVHSERQRPEVKAANNHVHGLQLWLALPAEHEKTDPAFYHYDQQQLPVFEQPGVSVRIMIGAAYGQTSPVITLSPTLYVEARVKAGRELTLPQASERALYVVEGRVTLKEIELDAHSMAILEDNSEVTVNALEDSIIVVIGGDHLGKRYMEWNFVASQQALITQAREDWKAGRFAKVPGDEDEFIPLPG